jgi:two-component system sensor histidine kinase CpxA
MTGDFFEGSMQLELHQARKAFESGGSPALKECLADTDSALRGTRYLLDARGRDLLSGADRSQMLSVGSFPLDHPHRVNGDFLIVKESADGKYFLVLDAPPPVPSSRFVPYFVLLTVAIAFLGWLLSIGIVSPLHRVATTVEHFGKGNLKVRVRSQRGDDIGDLARSFDSMADRIETLLTAERRLLQDVSHELRSPLARLSFAAELMKGAADPDEALDRMRREVVRLSQLIDNLLEVTRLEGDPSSREMQRFPFASLMQEVLRDCAFEAESRGIGITHQIAVTKDMEGNPELIRRAIENVLRNAIHYAPENSSIHAEAKQEVHGIVVTVSDAGAGVPEELLARIFDPFVRADESRDSSSGGVGLGLAIARRAVLLHHGTISAHNLHTGFQVTIVLPNDTVKSDLNEMRQDQLVL